MKTLKKKGLSCMSAIRKMLVLNFFSSIKSYWAAFMVSKDFAKNLKTKLLSSFNPQLLLHEPC